MSDDIEHLKVHKIVHRKDDGRVALGVVGQQATSEPAVREAFGGGETEVAAIRTETLRAQIIEALKGIHDPEIPVNIYDLGLIYGFEIDAERNVELEMTLTAPACPVAGVLVQQVARVVGEVPGVKRSHVKLTWDPPWTKDRMSEDALLELGLL